MLLGSRGIRDVPYTGDRSIDIPGAFLSVIGMGGLVVGVLAWQEGGESVALLLAIGAAAMGGLVYGSWERAPGQAHVARSDPVRVQAVQQRRSPDLLQKSRWAGS